MMGTTTQVGMAGIMSATIIAGAIIDIGVDTRFIATVGTATCLD